MKKKVRGTTASVPAFRVGAESEVERRALEIIASGAGYKISELASQFQLSASHLQRLFKRETGMRIGEWLIAQRLHRAAYLLTHSYLSVKAIARSAGYEHVSSFIRAFERKYSLTPTRYRARAEADSNSGGSVA
jgi:AraC-like DNA-binding protein